MTVISDTMGEAARCLIGGGGQADPSRGIRLLREASSRGEADASALLAALCAMGVAAPPDLGEALALLELAAQQGSQKARGQLMVLAGGDDDGTSLDQVDFKILAASVDLDAWLTPPHKQPLCETPRIRFLAGFLPKAGCEWLIEVGRGRVAPAGVYDAETGAVRQTNTRSNSAFKLGLLDLEFRRRRHGILPRRPHSERRDRRWPDVRQCGPRRRNGSSYLAPRRAPNLRREMAALAVGA